MCFEAATHSMAPRKPHWSGAGWRWKRRLGPDSLLAQQANRAYSGYPVYCPSHPLIQIGRAHRLSARRWTLFPHHTEPAGGAGGVAPEKADILPARGAARIRIVSTRDATMRPHAVGAHVAEHLAGGGAGHARGFQRNLGPRLGGARFLTTAPDRISAASRSHASSSASQCASTVSTLRSNRKPSATMPS